MLEAAYSFGDYFIQSQYNHFREIEDSLTPLTPEEWQNTSLSVALLAKKVLQISVYLLLEPLIGFFALVGTAITCITEQPKKGFQAILEDGTLWSKADLGERRFPKLMGVALSEDQYSGMNNCPNSQWAKFEKEALPESNQSREATDLWNRMDIHIEKLQELGVNSFRFSIEWSKIEPKKGEFDEEAIGHYVTLAKKLNDAGITPMACLLHFSLPQWVEDEGGILNPEFPKHLTRFGEKVFPYLSEDIPLWNTVNEPEIQAFMGYLLGGFPPSHHSVAEMAKGLKHLLQADSALCRMMKEKNPAVKVGLVHNVLRYKAYRWWHPLERLTCYYLTKMTHGVVRDYVKTGVFDFKVPFLAHERFTAQKSPYDFSGVNYYVRPILKQVFSSEFMISTHKAGGSMTKMPFREDPAGLYEAIMEMPGPVYVTENGTSARSDKQMHRYYDRAASAVSQAIKDGAEVEGYYAWSLSKNAEWAEGWDPQNFGLYDYDRNTKTFSLRPGAKGYTDNVQAAQKANS